MRYIRPIESTAAARDGWLLEPAEGAGCSIRLHRGGEQKAPSTEAEDRIVLVLQGEAVLTAEVRTAAAARDVVFIPAGVSAAVNGAKEAAWLEVRVAVTEARTDANGARVIPLDASRFQGGAFAHQALVDRSQGVRSLRMNSVKMQPGAGSPDWHIHDFAQMYVIQEGEMTVDVGHHRFAAPAGTLVVLPPGVVHRNFNGSKGQEQHVSLLVPEPREGEIFDYAVTIHPNEAELMTALPA